MRGLLIGTALVIACGQMALANSIPELLLISGDSNTVLYGSPDGTVNDISDTLNGWTINVLIGASNSPDLSGISGPFGIFLFSSTATCVGVRECESDALDVYISDIGFTDSVAVGGFVTGYNHDQDGGSTSQIAWFDPSNTFFGGVNDGGTPLGGTLIGVLGPFTSLGLSSDSLNGGGPAGPDAYSLTMLDHFSAGGEDPTFTTTGYITAVPEPGTDVLAGTVLILCAFVLLRWRLSERSR